LEGGYEICLEYPIKTFNVSRCERVFQTDTGPIILPDFSPQRNAELFVERFDLAFAAFNSAHWIEFVINAPTTLNDEISVNHYSKTRRIENARNSIITL